MKSLRLRIRLTRETGWLIAVFLFGLALRGYGVFSDSLWLDEGDSYLLALQPWGDLKAMIHSNTMAPPLYYLLCKPFVLALPHLATSVRLPSILASMATLVLLFFWVRRSFGERAALLATLLFAVSPQAVFYAQEGRNYALLGLAEVVILWALDRFDEKPQLRMAFIGGLASLVLLYLHNVSLIFWGITQGLIFWVHRKNLRRMLPWWWVQGVVGLAYLPWLPWLMHHAEVLRGNRALPLAWADLTWWQAFLGVLRNAVPGDGSAANQAPVPRLPIFSYLPTLVVLLGLGFSRFTLATERKKLMAWVCFIAAPVLFLVVYSDYVLPSFQLGRTDAIVIPATIAALGVALSRIRHRRLQVFVVSVLVATGLYAWGDYRFSLDGRQRHWDQQVARLAMDDLNDGLLILDIDVRPSVVVYVRQAQPTVTPWLFPQPVAEKRWDLDFLDLLYRADRRAAAVTGGLQNLNTAIEKLKPANIHVILTAAATANGLQYYPDRARLMALLEETLHYHLEGQPQFLPMDWQKGGLHQVLKFRR